MNVIISNGSFKFHLSTAAAELQRHQCLQRFITAGYPTPAFKRLLAHLPQRGMAALARLADREEDIDPRHISALWGPELLLRAGLVWARWRRQPTLAASSEAHAMQVYARQAQAIVAHERADVYHYRAGYGHGSVRAAASRGMLTLCDHSIAHPALVEYMIGHGGRYPERPLPARPAGTLQAKDRFWAAIDHDLSQADHILVNSDFVKRTMVFSGVDAKRVHVVYLGVDDQFLRHVVQRPALEAADPRRPLRLLYAGSLIPRKGFPTLASALQRIAGADWRLEVAGSADPALLKAQEGFFADPRVRYLGTLTRPALAQRMSAADVFVFPSLAEGSARVVFEAMAAGCCVIATDNTGSILQHGVHGFVVEPASVDDTERQVRQAMASREQVAQIGRHNQQLVFSDYRQRHYGDKLTALYRRLLAGREAPQAVEPAALESHR